MSFSPYKETDDILLSLPAMDHKIIVAIDGFSSCGKSTIARALAKQLGYSYVDSGAMYRAVALYFLENNVSITDIIEIEKALEKINVTFHLNNVSGISEVYLNGKNVEKEIRLMPVAEHVSRVSAIKEVRRKMEKLQQGLGKKKGIIMDGRDIGTHVFPHAEIKLFMTADPEVRALRRYDELKAKGTEFTMEEVRANIQKRDHADTTRLESPLLKAHDAIVIDNTLMTLDEQLGFVMRLIQYRLKKEAK